MIYSCACELHLQQELPEHWREPIAELLTSSSVFNHKKPLNISAFLSRARCVHISDTDIFIGEVDIAHGAWVYITFIFKVEGQKISLLDLFKRSSLKPTDTQHYRIKESRLEILNHQNELLHFYVFH